MYYFLDMLILVTHIFYNIIAITYYTILGKQISKECSKDTLLVRALMPKGD